MRLIDRLRGAQGSEERLTLEDIASQAEWFAFNGQGYQVQQTWRMKPGEEFGGDLPGHVKALQSSPPAFGAQLVRSLLVSQATPRWRSLVDKRIFGNTDLQVLNRPWVNGSFGELASKMEWSAGAAGNAFVYRQPGTDRLRLMRPDWTVIAKAGDDLESEVVGYAYYPGGINERTKPIIVDPAFVAHWSPLPDPLCDERGMSWMAPIMRDIEGDVAATTHKLEFFRNGATPNLVVKGIPASTREQFDDMVAGLERHHAGVRNAYKTLYLTAGADATVVGADMKQIDFAATQGKGETRISVASRVPAVVLGISEGLSGSSLNSGNYGMARRLLAEGWLYPTLQSMMRSLETLLPVPASSELWYDTGDMPFVREDAGDVAEIESKKASTIRTLVDGGFEPDSVIEAVQAQDMSRLVHTGNLSVQLLPPGTTGKDEEPAQRLALQLLEERAG